MLIYNGQALLCPTRQPCRDTRKIWDAAPQSTYQRYANFNAKNSDAYSNCRRTVHCPWKNNMELRMTRCHWCSWTMYRRSLASYSIHIRNCLKTKITQAKQLHPGHWRILALFAIPATVMPIQHTKPCWTMELHSVSDSVWLSFSRKIVNLAKFILRMQLPTIENKLLLRANMSRVWRLESFGINGSTKQGGNADMGQGCSVQRQQHQQGSLPCLPRTHMNWLAVHFSFTSIAIDSDAETEKLSGQNAARDWRLTSRHRCGVLQPHRRCKQSRSHDDLGLNIVPIVAWLFLLMSHSIYCRPKKGS